MAAVLVAVAGTSQAALMADTCLTPPPGAKYLPATCSHGLIQYFRQYPVLRLATPSQRERAVALRDGLIAAAETGNWSDLAAARRAGYDAHTAQRHPDDGSVGYFHAEREPEPRRGSILNVRRPKALVYANVPGHSPVLVGAMWTTRPGERAPTPGGPITRWHRHMLCGDARHHRHAPVNGRCPTGMHPEPGRVEMMHVWFTHDLRSAYAMRTPEPELCTAGLLPAGYCR